ncbi:MAG: hypothetical protein JSU70_08155 [Phycisphaerales bacterium]|nr:MAG: hypothetical protein JSU70_08155 [Phycisphaerales bacterium]
MSSAVSWAEQECATLEGGVKRWHTWDFCENEGFFAVALTPDRPKTQVLTVENGRTSPSTLVSLFGCGEEVSWKQVGDKIAIGLYNISMQDSPCEHTYTFAISDCRATK